LHYKIINLCDLSTDAEFSN
jgi:cobalamin biosynthesis Mg chelatase CobN